VPGDCTVLVIDGPRLDYTEPVVKAIGSYVEKGGRALFMLDPPLKMGRMDIAANAGPRQAARKLGRYGEQRHGAGHERGGAVVRAGPGDAARYEL